MSATLRPLYSMNNGVPAESETTCAWCGRRYSTLPFSTTLTSFGAVAFHFARRERVLERDIFRFGTATVISFLGAYEFSDEGSSGALPGPNWARAAQRGSNCSW